MHPSADITALIVAWQRGDHLAEQELFEALYHRLRAMAYQCLKSEPRCQSLGATALVHEAYLRFQQAERLDINGRDHFLALAARAMRRILVDRARARRSQKRGEEPVRTELLESMMMSDHDAAQIVSVDEALKELTRRSPRQAQLVELRYFAGFSEAEIASAMGISVRTARREWQVARTRLREAIDGSKPAC
jgi:RNA polymerase sigma-70 factor (ECF subfamily)